ncbi:MAG: hypothetical protein NC432_06820 [Roseburia sp.]|nr:hypothetical protein [Roseburia sp.]
MRLTGIVDYSMGNFLCIRGFCPMIQLADISETIPEIQRDLLSDHAGEMDKFLSGGEFTFFPEVILCSDLASNGARQDAIASFRMAVRQKQNFYGRVGPFKFAVKGYELKSKEDSRKKDNVQTVYMDFDEAQTAKFLRIDGNHRLSAVNEGSSYKDKAISFCLLLFSGVSETDKFCRALFHNINTKQIPLKDEENLNVIIESTAVFSDEDLAANFGTPYLYTRKLCGKTDLSHYPLIQKYIGDSKYTYFVGIFEHLLKQRLIENEPECVDVIIQKLSDINTALRESGIANVTENIAVLGAMTFYKLQGNEGKYKSFIRWVQKNNIGIADKLHINDVISIYDSVYAHIPKRVFLARWYPDSEPHLSKANGRLAVIRRIVEEDFRLQLIDLGTQGGGTYSIRDLMYREIGASDIFIADLTGNRHNVMVEVGYAIKNVGLERMLLYSESMEGAEKPPFDLNGFRYEPIVDSNDIELKVKPKLKDIIAGIASGEL